MYRPTNEPASSIYDAFQDEAKLRDSKKYGEWITDERNRVWRVAVDYAKKHNLIIPTIEDIKQCEINAMGHCDYGAKLAYGVQEILKA